MVLHLSVNRLACVTPKTVNLRCAKVASKGRDEEESGESGGSKES